MPGLGNAVASGQWLAGDRPDVSFLPAMQRRRLSALARSAFAVAHTCLEPGEAVPLILSSAHGEMARTVDLLRTLAQDEPLSPMSFSLSVHNAIAGQLSIALDNRAPVLALAPGAEGLAAAMVEACGLLQEGHDNVVVVWYDEPLPEPYPQFAPDEPVLPAALAVRLGRTGGTPLNLQRQPGEGNLLPLQQPLQLAPLLAALASGEFPLTTTATAAHWCWQLAPEVRA